MSAYICIAARKDITIALSTRCSAVKIKDTFELHIT